MLLLANISNIIELKNIFFPLSSQSQHTRSLVVENKQMTRDVVWNLKMHLKVSKYVTKNTKALKLS